MSIQPKVATYNLKVRLLFTFFRPLNIFNMIFFVKMWQVLSYGPDTIPGFFGKYSAAVVTKGLWQEEFSNWIWYFLVAAVVDVLWQEFLPTINSR